MAALASLFPDARSERFPTKRPLELDERGRVRAALAFITSGEREVLEFYFSADCTPAEISQKLQMPLSAIEARIGRGLFAVFHALILQASASLSGSPVRSRLGGGHRGCRKV